MSAAAVLLVASCTPALNWRETLLGDSGLQALFPCKPDVVTRRVKIGGTPVEMTLHACTAAGSVFGVSHAVLADARLAAAALDELSSVAAANLGAAIPTRHATHIAGLAADAPAFAMRLASAGPSSATPLEERAVWFADGVTVFQASVVAKQVDADAADTFFEGLKSPR